MSEAQTFCVSFNSLTGLTVLVKALISRESLIRIFNFIFI
jgi:hypothetical protein